FAEVLDRVRQEWHPAATNDPDRTDLLPGCAPDAVQRWVDLLPDAEQMTAAADLAGSVVSHGDYHPYNVAIRGEERIVIDWEYVHRNHRYWDLYSLLDITSFRYAKVPLQQSERIAALRRYWEQSAFGSGDFGR